MLRRKSNLRWLVASSAVWLYALPLCARGDSASDAAQSPPPVSADPVPVDSASGARKASAHSQFGASGSPPPASVTATGFDFGSYGRVGIGSDLRGHTGHAVNVVSFGSRLEKPAYLELNFYYGHRDDAGSTATGGIGQGDAVCAGARQASERQDHRLRRVSLPSQRRASARDDRSATDAASR